MLQRGLIVGFLLVSLGVQYWAHSVYQPSRLSIKEGATAPAWLLEDLDGKAISSADLSGRIVILDFWATWCVPCREEFVVLKEWWDGQQPTGRLQGVELLAVNVGEPAPLIEEFLKSNPIPFRVARDGNGSVAQAFGVNGLPALIMIDRDGRVACATEGYDPMVGGLLNDELNKVRKGRAE